MAEDTVTVPEDTNDALAALAVSSGTGAIAQWTDDKKKDYVSLFKKRASASMYILRMSASVLASKAKDKQFLGVPRYNKLVEDCNHFNGDDVVRGKRDYYDNSYDAHAAWKETYDRSKADLDGIVGDRVTSLIKNLPSLNAAMLILDPDTAAKMERRDALREKGQEITDAFEELSMDIKLADMPQDMTIGAFRAHVKEIENKRKAMLEELQEIGKEGQDLERAINKALFKGLPGIGEEIESVVKELYQQSRDLAVTCRDVENVVLYGDNVAALKILETFKTDERKITSDIGLRFQNGLELLKLKLAGKKPKKAKEAPPAPPAGTLSE